MTTLLFLSLLVGISIIEGFTCSYLLIGTCVSTSIIRREDRISDDLVNVKQKVSFNTTEVLSVPIYKRKSTILAKKK